jgi:hypothetical protein
LAQERDTDARAERSDAALVAQYIHELSERHGIDGQAALSAGEGTVSEDSDDR